MLDSQDCLEQGELEADLTDGYLVLVDADKVHDYVFSPHELKLIRGGSRLQRELAEVHLPALAQATGGVTIFSGGGRVLAKFPSEPGAMRFLNQALTEFADRTHVSSATAAMCTYLPGQFEVSLAAVQSRLERSKSSRVSPVFAPGNWFYRSCDKCGRFPASSRAQADTAFVCAGCRARLERSQREPGSPDDFEAIGRMGRPEGYLALVYLDMDRLGRLLATHATTEESYATWSRTIDESVRGAVEHALGKTGRTADGDALFEILLIGGDDAVIVMAPHLIFEFVAEFQGHLDALCHGRISPRPNFSVGILIAHHHYPIRDFVQGAERLMRSAKSIRGQDSVDFCVLTQSMQEDPLSGRGYDESLARLTAKPYAVSDFVELGQKAMRIKEGAGSSRVRQIGRILGGSKLQVEIEYGYMVARSQRAEKELLVREIGWSPYRESADGRFDSSLGDIVELWRLV